MTCKHGDESPCWLCVEEDAANDLEMASLWGRRTEGGTMTPEQRTAAERLAQDLDAYHTRSEHKEAAALLRELLAEPMRQPLADKEIIALPEWNDYVGGCCTLLDFARAVERTHGIGEKT